MDESPRIKIDGYGPIPIPNTIEEWMDPALFPGQSINWYMTRTIYLEKLVPKELINPFYYSDEHRAQFEQILKSTRGSEYLNLICNACHYITDEYHQLWLLQTVANVSEAAAEFLITDLEESSDPNSQALMKFRNTLWQLIK